MQYTVLGSTGVEVSRLCLGTMSFGGDADSSESAKLFARCRDVGINFFDCADVYNNGRAEEILGDLMARERDDLVITSKVNGALRGDRNARGLSRRHIVRAVEDSLRRLRTDRLDFYFLHQEDPQTYLEDSLGALEDLVRAGKIVYPAISNHPAWRIVKAIALCEARGWAKPRLLQPMYSLAKRQAEVEILPMAHSEKLGVISYSPLGGGLLSGKYASAEAVGRLKSNPIYAKRYGDEKYFALAQNFSKFAQNCGVHPATLAVSWAMQNPTITAPIIGARNLEQLEPSLQAANYEMSEEQYAEISALSETPAPATDRSETQK